MTDSNCKSIRADEINPCSNCQPEQSTSFKYLELSTGDNFMSDRNDSHHIIFVLEGDVIVNSGMYVDRQFSSGQMVLIRRYSNMEGCALSNARVMLFGFDTPISNCDKLALKSYLPLCDTVVYNFTPLEIRQPLTGFFEMLIFCLKGSIECYANLYNLKHLELFFYLRNYYTRKEIATLFYPLLTKSVDFKEFVLQNYKQAKTISDLIEMSSLGRSNFFKKFKEEFGMSVKRWLDSQTMQNIMYHAIDPNLSIKEVMYRSGFDNTSHFNRFCKQQTGCTASELFQRIRDK